MRPLLQETIWKKLEESAGPDARWTLCDYMRAAAAAWFEPASQQAPALANDDVEPAHSAIASPARVGHLENPRPRTSDARDRRNRDRTGPYFKQLVAAEASASFSRNPLPLINDLPDLPAPLSLLPPPPLTPFHDNDDHPQPENDNDRSALTKAQARRAAQDARDTRQGPDWKRTRDTGKLAGMGRAIVLDGGASARTFTLNPAPDAIARALASDHNGFASWFQKRIRCELRAVGLDLPFTFAVDVTRTRRPHLHGLIAANDDQLPAAERALKRAGGLWTAARSEKQVHTGIVWNSDGWTSYSSRNLAAARKVVGSGVIAGTGALRREARELHERLRAAEIAGR